MQDLLELALLASVVDLNPILTKAVIRVGRRSKQAIGIDEQVCYHLITATYNKHENDEEKAIFDMLKFLIAKQVVFRG